jgi:hypothetical protein
VDEKPGGQKQEKELSESTQVATKGGGTEGEKEREDE